MNSKIELDLVDEMQFEDSNPELFISLEDAGLENIDYDTVSHNQVEFYYTDEA